MSWIPLITSDEDNYAIVLLAVILNLTSCVVGNMDSSDYLYVPWIQVFQKVDSTGQTNIRERKEALYSCGVDRSENLDDKNWGLNYERDNETLKQLVERNERIFSCMKGKIPSILINVHSVG